MTQTATKTPTTTGGVPNGPFINAYKSAEEQQWRSGSPSLLSCRLLSNSGNDTSGRSSRAPYRSRNEQITAKLEHNSGEEPSAASEADIIPSRAAGGPQPPHNAPRLWQTHGPETLASEILNWCKQTTSSSRETESGRKREEKKQRPLYQTFQVAQYLYSRY